MLAGRQAGLYIQTDMLNVDRHIQTEKQETTDRQLRYCINNLVMRYQMKVNANIGMAKI